MPREAAALRPSVAWAVAAAAVSTTLALLLLECRRRSGESASARLRRAVRAAQVAPAGLLLARARLPAAVLLDSCGAAADAEGLFECDVHIRRGTIVAISAAGTRPAPHGAVRADAGRAIVLPCFADSRTNLSTTQTVPWGHSASGALADAADGRGGDRPGRFAAGDLERRMDFALRCAWHHGSRAVRTVLGRVDATRVDPKAYVAFDVGRAAWQKRGLVLQGVASMDLLAYSDTAAAEAHAQEAARHPGVVLGACCGDIVEKQWAQAEAAFDALFLLAARHSFDVDLEIDDSDDAAVCALLPFCASLRRARSARGAGFRGHVLLGAAGALSLQSAERREQVLSSLRLLGPLAVVITPSASLGLRGRLGDAGSGAANASMLLRTPQWRGLTLVQELRSRGTAVVAASGSVRDSRHPFGDYDPLSVLAASMVACHLDAEPSQGAWADLVTSSAFSALGLGPGALRSGARADLVVFPGARCRSELLARPQADRVVLRAGAAQESSLPQYAELDDLVQDPALR